MKFSDSLVAKLKVHAIFRRKARAPKPSMAIKNRGDEGQANLHRPVSALVKHSIQVEVNSSAPRMIAHRHGRASDESRAKHPGRAKTCKYLGLVLSNVRDNFS